jgi:hypothetical protein
LRQPRDFIKLANATCACVVAFKVLECTRANVVRFVVVSNLPDVVLTVYSDLLKLIILGVVSVYGGVRRFIAEYGI